MGIGALGMPFSRFWMRACGAVLLALVLGAAVETLVELGEGVQQRVVSPTSAPKSVSPTSAPTFAPTWHRPFPAKFRRVRAVKQTRKGWPKTPMRPASGRNVE